jgi:ATP-dependent protease HslVU (ClpYQ) ATPase subunit
MHSLVHCLHCLLQVRVAEQEGIVFIDEIDKIVNSSGMLRHGECAILL